MERFADEIRKSLLDSLEAVPHLFNAPKIIKIGSQSSENEHYQCGTENQKIYLKKQQKRADFGMFS